MPSSGARPARHRIGAQRAEGGDPGRQARQAGGGRRAQGAARRGVDPHRDHPLQDAARGRARPARPAPARRARPDARGGVRAAGARAADGPHRGGRGRRDRGRPRAVPPQPRRLASRRGPVREREHGQDARRRGADQRQADHRRLRDAARASGLGPVRRQDGDRLRRPAQARAPRAALDGRGGRRRHRRRVRVDVRRAGDEGDRGRQARPRAQLPRRRDRRGLPVPAAAPERHVPPARAGRGRGCRRRRAGTARAAGVR